MTRLIRNGALVEDVWHRPADEAELVANLARGVPSLLPLARWQAHREAALAARAGVELGPADDPQALLTWLPDIPLIAIHFPLFTDGRGYSLARLLRHRHGYAGELRAVGDVLRDQLYFLQRCGFDAFQLRADQLPEAALAAFRDYAWTPLGAR